MAIFRMGLALLAVLITAPLSLQTPCAWVQPRAGTVRGALYIDGGQYWENQWNGTEWTNEESNVVNTPPGYVQQFNYSTPFKSSTSAGNISSLLSSIPLTAGGSYDAPCFLNGAMFVDNYEYYTYGGVPTADYQSDSILRYWLYASPGQTIFTAGPTTNYPLPNGITNYITHGASACAPSESTCFYFGGMHAPGYATLLNGALPGTTGGASLLADTLLTIDMSNPSQAAWSNNTLDSSVSPRAAGELVWLPVGEKGILLAIGGVLDPIDLNGLQTTDDTATAEETDNSFMTFIPIYDIATKKWTTQQTFGGSPQQLAHFCTAIATSKNSYDIFVYGGDNGVNYGDANPASDTVWVLSVPSFTWVNIGDGTPPHARSGHVCSMPFPNQMLVVGGQNVGTNNYCIQDGTVFDIFDLNKLEWTGEYDPLTYSDYQQPSTIAAATAAQSSPINTDVASLFSSAYPSPIPSWYPYPIEKNSNGNSGGSSTPIGAIVGGVLGGIALTAVAILAWCCRPSKRRERRARKERRQSEVDTESTAQSRSVWQWARNTPAGMPPPKLSDIISDTATEVDESLSPPMETAEVFGDTYFSPVRRSLMSADGNARSNRYSGSPVHTSLPPRSPRSMHSTSVEADGEQVHELHNESRNSKVSSELNQTNPHFRNHPLYPHSIDGHLSNGAAASDMSPPSHATDRMGATSPGPVPSELSEHGDTDTQLTSSVSEHVGTAKALPITRPGHNRNSSSVSSGIPVTTPPPVIEDNGRRPEMGQQRNSLPISPLLQQEGHRPSHHRHGSSLSEMLLSPTGDAAVPRDDDEDADRTLVNSPVRRKPVGSAYDETRKRFGM